jgi:hypothetical protein
MRFYVRRGHAFGVHGYDFRFHVLCKRVLMLSHKLRLKFAVPVPRHSDFGVPVAHVYGFLRISVPAGFRFLVAVIIARAAQFLVKLAFKARFDDLALHFSQHFLKIVEIAY